MLLYLPQTNTQRFNYLSQLGAPQKPGVFELDPHADWRDAIRAVAEHRVAAVDSAIHPWLLPCLWWAMRPDPAGAGYVGPAIYFEFDAIESPELPAGSVPIAEVTAAYLAAAPVAVPPAPRRIGVRSYASASPLWRRTITERPPSHPAVLRDWLGMQRALPSPERLVRWYRDVRGTAWRALALRRMLERLAAGAIVAWQGSDEIPDSWWSSGIGFDAELGAVFSAGGTELARALTIYRRGEQPAAVATREAVAPDADRPAIARALIDRHRTELAAMPSRADQSKFLNDRVAISETLIRKELKAAFGRLVGGPKRVRRVGNVELTAPVPPRRRRNKAAVPRRLPAAAAPRSIRPTSGAQSRSI